MCAPTSVCAHACGCCMYACEHVSARLLCMHTFSLFNGSQIERRVSSTQGKHSTIFILFHCGGEQALTALVFMLLPLADLDPCNPPASAHNSCVSGIAGVFVDCMSFPEPLHLIRKPQSLEPLPEVQTMPPSHHSAQDRVPKAQTSPY